MRTSSAIEQWTTDEERWCEVCQQDDAAWPDGTGYRERVMPLTIPTPAFPFRVCAECAEEWDAMVTEDERQALGLP